MKLLTKQDVINAVKDGWKYQYCNPAGYWTYEWSLVKYEKLQALGDSPKASDIDEIIGNNCWTDLKCSLCRKDVEVVVTIEDKTSDEEVYICKKCAKKINKIFKTLGEVNE